MSTLGEAVAKSIKALNHKDTKAQRKPFFVCRAQPGKPGKNVVSACLCGSRLFVTDFKWGMRGKK